MKDKEEDNLANQLMEEYKQLLEVTDDESTIVMCFYKLGKASSELNWVREMYGNTEIGEYEAFLRMDILLGAMAEVRKEVKSRL